jgi:hypothetical protein
VYFSDNESVTFGHLGARATCKRTNGWETATFSGLITGRGYRLLADQVDEWSESAKGVIIRLDGALTALSEGAEVGRCYRGHGVPGAIIVRDDQYDYFAQACANSTQAGVIRTCWLLSQLEHAKNWVRAHSLHLTRRQMLLEVADS